MSRDQAATRRDLATICGRRQRQTGTNAILAAADALNRAGIVDPQTEQLLGDALVEELLRPTLSAERIVEARHLLLLTHPGTVARLHELVALWDEGPELRVVASHLGDGDPEVIAEVPWAGSGLDANDGDIVAEGNEETEGTALGRAKLRYLAARLPGSQGTPRFQADLDSEWWSVAVSRRWR